MAVNAKRRVFFAAIATYYDYMLDVLKVLGVSGNEF